MSKLVKRYKLLKDLPMYPAGSVIVHEYDELPSQFNSGTYFTDGNWYGEDRRVDGKPINVPIFVEHLVRWCSRSQRNDDNHDDWVEEL